MHYMSSGVENQTMKTENYQKCVGSLHVCLLRQYRRKMVNDFRYYRALESVSKREIYIAPKSRKRISIASALSTALAIYPCQIRVYQRWHSKLQLPTARKKEWRPATADSSPHAVTCQHCDTHYFSQWVSNPQPSDRWSIVVPTRYQWCHRLVDV